MDKILLIGKNFNNVIGIINLDDVYNKIKEESKKKFGSVYFWNEVNGNYYDFIMYSKNKLFYLSNNLDNGSRGFNNFKYLFKTIIKDRNSKLRPCKGIDKCMLNPELKCPKLIIKTQRGVEDCLFCEIIDVVVGHYSPGLSKETINEIMGDNNDNNKGTNQK